MKDKDKDLLWAALLFVIVFGGLFSLFIWTFHYDNVNDKKECYQYGRDTQHIVKWTSSGCIAPDNEGHWYVIEGLDN